MNQPLTECFPITGNGKIISNWLCVNNLRSTVAALFPQFPDELQDDHTAEAVVLAVAVGGREALVGEVNVLVQDIVGREPEGEFSVKECF